MAPATAALVSGDLLKVKVSETLLQYPRRQTLVRICVSAPKSTDTCPIGGASDGKRNEEESHRRSRVHIGANSLGRRLIRARFDGLPVSIQLNRSRLRELYGGICAIAPTASKVTVASATLELDD